MQNSYDLPPRKALACRWASAFFALIAIIAFATPIAMIAITGDPMAKWVCNTTRDCGFVDGSQAFLDAEEWQAMSTSPAAADRFADYVARWPIKIGGAVLSILSTFPFALLMFAVAMALRAFGTARGIASGIRWMRLAAWAAIGAALASPLVGLLWSVLLLPGTPHGPGFRIEIDGGPLMLHLLLAFASFAVVWALDAGLRAQRDLAEIV